MAVWVIYMSFPCCLLSYGNVMAWILHNVSVSYSAHAEEVISDARPQMHLVQILVNCLTTCIIRMDVVA